MITLIIDTTNFSTAHLEIKRGQKIVGQKSFKAERRLSEKLLPNIIRLLEKAELNLQNLGRIEAYKSEQGSFTGQRVGMAVAKALGFGLEIKVRIVQRSKISRACASLTKIKN